MSGGGNPIFQEFVEDYYAECDEHLAAIRHVLLALESRPVPALEEGEIQELARRLHTLKGLSAMVGLSSAEALSHALEDVVRAAVAPKAPLSVDTVDCLFAGTTLIDRSVQAKRDGRAAPPYEQFIRRAEFFATEASQGRHVDGAQHHVATVDVHRPAGVSPAAGAQYFFEFTPSTALATRGVGVEVVRKRLQEIGTIERTTPRTAEGKVTFQFVVRLNAGAEIPDSWADDGLHWLTAPSAIVPAAVVETPAAPVVSGASTNMVRVELGRVDDLMRMIGEMVVLRSRLDDTLRRANGSQTLDDIRETNVALERQLRTLREGVMRIRLVPVGEVFERMRFAMRDVVRQSGKSIRLEISGGDTQIDKLIVDRMVEPLLHLVRNAASHGIEDRGRRSANGKPAEGLIALRARAAGDRIMLETEDDGAGIDAERVLERAHALGLMRDRRALTDDELLDVICSPGFSTRETADMASGRGVGMSVVRSTIRALGGELFLSTVPGQGTRFTIELPLTLMIADALLVEVGGQPMAVPQVALREIVPFDPAQVTSLETSDVISYRGMVLPLITLHRLFTLKPPADAKPHVLVVGTDAHLTGLVVDRLIGLREIVVHPVSDPLLAVPGIAAATELADGRISLIIDVAGLTRRAREMSGRRYAAALTVGGAAS